MTERLERSVSVRRAAVAAAVGLLAATLSAQGPFTPARYRGGAVPALAVNAVGGGEVLVELTVDAAGRVSAASPLRVTPPFASAIVDAARTWQFAPAEELVQVDSDRGPRMSRAAVASKILVAAVVRPPTLNTPTLGEPPRDVAAGSEDLALPSTTATPPYPPTARDGGSVLLEASISATGAITAVKVLQSAPPFDEAARTALLQWRFRPARWRGQAVASVVYVIFGFPPPVVG